MSASALADEQGRKIFLGGLSFDAREGDLRSDFSKYGELEDVQLPMGDGGKHKGFAFLTYVKAEDAQEACKVHHQQQYLGREISAKIVVPRSDRGGDRGGGGGRGNLPALTREQEDKLEDWVQAKRRRDFEAADRLREIGRAHV
jgi:RNA recognition motif-containing protein